MKAGDTFLIRDRDIDEHLWVIISEPDLDDSRVVIVNMTTAHPSKERFCLIQAGEHPFVVHETCVSYRHAKATSRARLVQLAEGGQIRPHVPVSAELLARMRRGVPMSNLMPMDLAALIARQRLF